MATGRRVSLGVKTRTPIGLGVEQPDRAAMMRIAGG
jgi:hypothetical protein